MAKVSKKAPTKTKQDRSGKPPDVSAAYFLSLEVEKILCFKDSQTLDLSDNCGMPAQWTVILGDNGVGKTTLLRCLAGMQLEFFAQDEHDSIYFPLFDLNPDFMDSWLQKINDCAYELGADEIATTTAKIACQAPLLALKSNAGINYEEGNIEVGIFEGCSLSVPKSENAMLCYGYGAIRNLGSGALSNSPLTDNSLSLFAEGSPLINAEEWMLQTDYAYQTANDKLKKHLKKQLGQIFDILKRILPDVADIRIAPATEENLRPRAEFLTPYGWVHINSLGLGYRTAIAWMVDLAVRLFRRYPNSPDPLAEPAIVLVDEIDLHLHPRWQRTIMDFLTERFPNTQFIVTAHSPLVVQAAQNANIVLLRREGDRVVIDNDPEIIKNWRVDQVLTSVFELPSSRPPQIERLLEEHEKILAKAHLTPKDEARLEKLAAQIGPLPTANTLEDIEAMDIIRQAAKLLKNV
jgi:AAA domain, putative AbiEii toxin, Type IV TA system/AAA domain